MILFATAVVPACAPLDEEAEVRAFVAEAEIAVESRSTGFFRSHIGEDYADASGRRRDDIIAMLRGLFLVNSEIEVINRIVEVKLDGDDFATVILQSALIGSAGRARPIDIDADFYSIEIELARNGSDWELIGASWQRFLQ
jgi:hypothetical protein